MHQEIEIDILNNKIFLDEECSICNCGRTKPNSSSINERCRRCNGIGYVLTDVGEGIFNLIKRHMRNIENKY